MAWKVTFTDGSSGQFSNEELNSFDDNDIASAKEIAETSDEMRARAKSEFATDMEEQRLAEEESIKSSPAYNIAKMLSPRVTENTLNDKNLARNLVGGIFDAGSLPGRTLGGAAAGLGAGIGDYYSNKDLGQALSVAGANMQDFMSTKGSDKSQGFFSALPEDIVKDPLAIPSLMIPGGSQIVSKIGPRAAEFVASKAKYVKPIAEGISQGTQNLFAGLGERFADKNQDGSALQDFGFGAIFGGGGNKAGDLMSQLGNTEIGRQILKKLTPTEKLSGGGNKLSTLIREGYGIDITDGKQNIDPNKLGKFLSEQSVPSDILSFQTPRSRITDYIESERGKTGKLLGDIIKSEEFPKINIGDKLTALEARYRGETGSPEINDILREAGIETADPNEQKIYNREELESYINEIRGLLPRPKTILDDSYKIIPQPIPYKKEVTGPQAQELRDFLYNDEKPTSLRYVPTKGMVAGELRKEISEDIGRGMDVVQPGSSKLNKQFAAMKELEKLTDKSAYFSPDRPAWMPQGIVAGVFDAGKQAARVLAEKPAIQKSAKAVIQSLIRSENRKDNDNTAILPDSSKEFTAADNRIINRAVEALRFNPNDKSAQAILRSYGL